MSIYASMHDVGTDCDGSPDKSVLTYKGSHIYPDRGTHKPGLIGLGSIPSWCVPGQEDNEEDYWGGEWLRLDVGTWNDKYERPMTSNEATVVLDRSAAADLARRLQAWANHKPEGGES